MHRVALLLVLTTCAVLHVAAKEKPSLERAAFFAVGPISDGARTSDGEHALRAALGQADRVATFRRLVDSASPAGQLYALLGLRLSDAAAFTQALPAFTSREDRVETMIGCIGSDDQVRVIAQKIAHGDYDNILRRPAR